MSDFFVIFESVADPRDINARHDLREILFIALAAMLCGAESCVEMAEFGRNKEALLRKTSSTWWAGQVSGFAWWDRWFRPVLGRARRKIRAFGPKTGIFT